jgi:hypothetical protein
MKRLNLLILAVFALWLAAPWVGYALFPSWEERGQFGDLFGSVNALFSGLAFTVLIYAIFLQKKELSLQRVELKLQREEMAASRAELAAQVAAQNSLVYVTACQIKVAAAQFRIDLEKMELGFHERQHIQQTDIPKIAAGIARMVDELDVRLNALQATSKATPDKPIETISEGDKKSG